MDADICHDDCDQSTMRYIPRQHPIVASSPSCEPVTGDGGAAVADQPVTPAQLSILLWFEDRHNGGKGIILGNCFLERRRLPGEKQLPGKGLALPNHMRRP
jgi:hypothetical protein